MNAAIYSGEDLSSHGEHRIAIVNPGDRDWTKHRFILAFGAYLDTYTMVWANSIEDALDEVVDWLVEHEPGLLADEQVAEAYKEALAEAVANGADPTADETIEAAQAEAETDTTCAGNNGNYLLSWEWTIVATDPTRAQVLAIMGRGVSK